ncbi:hypothetical protein [Bacteroides faecalis]|uniref:hypothetical protein n=1 Tax=Bacteroides faecalis TaxID=2447885 RepID=UPI001F1CF3F7|nr:hypothetical protein [Bacteroides faecalis]
MNISLGIFTFGWIIYWLPIISMSVGSGASLLVILLATTTTSSSCCVSKDITTLMRCFPFSFTTFGAYVSPERCRLVVGSAIILKLPS